MKAYNVDDFAVLIGLIKSMISVSIRSIPKATTTQLLRANPKHFTIGQWTLKSAILTRKLRWSVN